MTKIFLSPLTFVAVFGSGIRDPGSEIRDPGSGMDKNPGSGIPDPQHWFFCVVLLGARRKSRGFGTRYGYVLQSQIMQCHWSNFAVLTTGPWDLQVEIVHSCGMPLKLFSWRQIQRQQNFRSSFRGAVSWNGWASVCINGEWIDLGLNKGRGRFLKIFMCPFNRKIFLRLICETRLAW